ncbi:hypothetical protein ALP86_101972 [Pseudomonas amygdali pv. mori]|uniref:Uncharacterized protein n=1 Tax=Pseudomonas amygdali pv. mori TaxID=34065 RepID=A0A3M4ULM0_PSEA0|nr:hypothetical protein ALQ05_101497 [Pseudomonas amygdali pv. mori]RMR39929.1 hypothetical protein ALP86_101972 [Pseudomonas amygdali pv. mori]RMT23284.1 hypothetical protein ALP52_101836 [Pseudomonas amygdali pv. mori]
MDMANLGVKGTRTRSAGADWALAAPLIKKCAILAVSGRDDQRLDENCDVCQARGGFMLKERLAVARACILCLRNCRVREGGALVETFRICRTYLATLSTAS